MNAKNFINFVRGKEYPPPVVMGTEKLMKKKAHGSTEKPVQENLRWSVDQKKADKICCFNRHYAEHSQYFVRTKWLKEMEAKGDTPTEYYDSVTGKLLFTAPIGRTFAAFLKESKKHGWPSFRDQEVNWKYVRILPGGECVSVDGTHLGHNLPDRKGNRYCINLVSVAGRPVHQEEAEASAPPVQQPVLKVFQLQKNQDRCTGLFWRSNPTKGRVRTLSHNDWPKDDALLKGIEHEVKGEKWLEVKEIQQPGYSFFKETEASDVWIPFFHEQYFLVEQTDI